MADPTEHYEWDVPTVGGDTGAWGTILNDLFDAQDSDLFAAETKADDALRENLEQPLIGVQGSAGVGWEVGLTATADAADGMGELFIPLPHLRSGQRITAFSSYALAANGTSGEAALCYMDSVGSETVVSSGHALPTTGAALTTTGSLTHDVDINRHYYVKVSPSGSAGFVRVWFVQLVVDRP